MRIVLFEITLGVCGGYIVPGVRTTLGDWSNVLHIGSHKVRKTQVPIDSSLANPTRPRVEFEKG